MFVTVKKVSEILDANEKTIYSWAETGIIPCYKLNGLLRFKLEEVVEWAKSCKRELSKI